VNSRTILIGILFLSSLLIILLSNNVATIGDEIENMLTNPDFDQGTTGWIIGSLADGAAGLISAEKVKPAVGGAMGDCLFAKIDGVGNDAWEPEIHSPSFDVKAGETYTVSFWAKTEAGKVRPLGVKFEQLDTWTGPSTTIDTITDEWTEYHFSPEMTMSSPPQVVIHIQFNAWKEDVWFDHFRVYLGEYVAEDISPDLAIGTVGKLGATWGDIKNR
jgi:hypothetical protein